MILDDFYSNFNHSLENGDLKSANKKLMYELGRILVQNKNEFVDLLNESEIPATADMNDIRLIDLYVDNISKNKKLMLGTSILINVHNQKFSADGDDYLDDENIKDTFRSLNSYYSDDYSNSVGAVAGAVGEVAKLGGKISEGQQKKKYGALDLATKKEDTKQALVQSVLAGQQAVMEATRKRQEQKAKTTRTLLVIGGAIALLGVLGLVIYKIKKGK
jgi:hypothetical protein